MSARFATTLSTPALILYQNCLVVLARTSFMANVLESGLGSRRKVNVHFVRTISGHDLDIFYLLSNKK